MKAITWVLSAAICIALAFMFFACSSDSSGDSGSTSNFSSSSVGNGTLSPPANVAAAANSANSITISWSAVTGAAEYYVYRSTSPTDSYALVGSSTATSYTDNNLSAATTYYYRVASHGSTGTGSQSGFVSATTQPGGEAGGSSSGGSDGASSSSAGVLELIPNPDPPTGVITSTNSTSSISIGWGAVSGATGYYVYRSESTTGAYVQVGSSTATSYTDDGLSSGTTYYYRVSGYNSGGTGSQSSFVSGTTHSSAPAGVTLTVNSANGITVSWSASAGAINYRIYRSESGNDGTYALVYTSSTAAPYANTGLAMATKYYYRVAAYNAGGEGPMSEAVSETTLSFVPTNVTAAVNSPTSITVSWSAVAGASNYRVYRSTSIDGTYTQVGGSITATSYTNTGLTTGTTYYYRVAAYNSSNGEGPRSEAVSETPRTTPSAPQNFTATPGNGQVVLSWTAPSSHGGSDITGYQVSSNNGTSWVAASSNTSHTFTGLTNGTSYTFKVRAVNAAGNGAEASASATPRTTPSVPQNFTATPSNGQVALSWAAPSSNGGSAITGYQVSSNNGSTWVTASSSASHTFTSLANGTSYTFKVRAVNAAGSGAEVSVTETPRAAPSMPQNFTATPGNGQVALSWAAPSSNGGSAITGYQVSSNNGSTWVTASSSTSHTFTSLANGTSYTFKVRAVNAVGNGTEASVSATTWATPSAPQSFTATSGNGQVALSWAAPSSNGGSAITGYQVSSNNGTSWVAASSSTSHTFTSLTNGTSYTFKIRAVNAAGNGAEASVAATPRNYGSVSDGAGRTYKTIVIGTQTWMAENLNYNVTGSVCYGNINDNCEKYGRLYNWATAMGLNATYNSSSWGSTDRQQGICPDGWHLPNNAEWNTLRTYVGTNPGTKLKATSGWNSYSGVPTGTDSYGFAALPGGYGHSGGFFLNAGDYGYWWSASEYGAGNAYYRGMNYIINEDVSTNSNGKTDLFSVRCLQDSAP